MKKIIFSLGLILSVTLSINALPSVAICGFDASGSTSGAGDEFSFVLLRDFAAGEVIYFTEDEYSVASSSFNSGEGHLEYTVPAGGLLEDDVVRIRETGVNVFTVECATGSAVHIGSSGAWSYSGSDELYAYSASNPAAPWSTVTEIHCFYYGSVIAPPVDQDPTPDWPNTILLAVNLGDGGSMNADFLDAFRVNTTLSQLKAKANWLKSGSDITLSCTDFTNNMLPIELLSFDARMKGSEVLLEWTTESEVNNERFEIEHSRDGKNFTSIGSLAGSGTTNKVNVYKMIHTFPHLGINYYRLKQIDYDGTFSHSDIEAVNFYDNKYNNTLSAYPNPFNQDITLQFSLSEEYNSSGKTRTIEVYDVYGKLALSIDVPMDETNTTVDLSELQSGTYFLQTLDGQNLLTKVQKIVKL